MTTAMTLSIHLLWAATLLGLTPADGLASPSAPVSADSATAAGSSPSAMASAPAAASAPASAPAAPASSAVSASSPEAFTMVGDRPEQVVAAPRPAIDEAIRPLLDDQHIVGLAVGVVERGRTTFLKGYGYADLEARTPVSADATMFRWASISKPLTAIVAKTLERREVVDFARPIETWYQDYRVPRDFTVECKRRRKTVEVGGRELPCEDGYAEATLPRDSRHITLRHLLSHTAGIIGFTSPRGRVYPKSRTLNDPLINRGLEWGLKRVFTKPLLSPPGVAYAYSTFGFNLAAVVLQRASGVPFPQLVHDIIAGPAGMPSLQPDYEWVDIPNRAAGYKPKRRRGRVREMVREPSYDVSWKMGGGGFVSTPADLARFCGALMGDQLLSVQDKKELWTEQSTSDGEPTDYALGFAVGERDGRPYVEHAGVQPKARSRLRLYPDEDLCIVVMSNTTTAKTKALVEAIDSSLQRQARATPAPL